MSSRSIHSTTAAIGPLPKERALKTDILTILFAVYQQQQCILIQSKFTFVSFNGIKFGDDYTPPYPSSFLIPSLLKMNLTAHRDLVPCG